MMCIYLPRQIYTWEFTHAANAAHLLTVHLEEFAVDNGGVLRIILLLANPHLLEGGQRGRDGAPDPHRGLAFRSDDLGLHHAGCQSCDLLLHPVGDARVHGGPARQHRVSIEFLPDVDVTLHDGIEGGLHT